MYEAKFILGAIAGSLTKSDKLGYVCDYPIYGQIAGINAFALGAQMANPRAKVYLEWSAVDGARAAAMKLVDQGIHFISSQDTARFREDDREIYGLSYINGERSELIANPVWKWGVYYEEILRRVLNKTMQAEYESSNKALNYYWGMSAGVVDVVFSPWLSAALQALREFPARRNHSERLHPLPHSADKAERRDYRRGSEIARSRPDHQHGLPRRERDRHDSEV